MSKKIIMILSLFSKDTNADTVFEYLCPDGKIVNGSLSNEPAVKYLLSAHPDISEILCICSTLARENTYEFFSGRIMEFAPSGNIVIDPIDYDNAADSFENGPLTKILEKTHKGDEVYLETSGGQRNDIMQLLLITRALSYAGVKTMQAVYAQKFPPEVKDITDLINKFDLIEGMQNMSSLGSIKKLRDYYPSESIDPHTERLLNATDVLIETIEFCRIGKIDECMKEFNEALTDAQRAHDPVFLQLLPTFRQKFGKDGKMKFTGLVRWCIDSGMLQQAVTIYTEKMPNYIINEHGREYLKVSEEELATDGLDTVSESHADKYSSWFARRFMNLSTELDRYDSRNNYEYEIAREFTALIRQRWHEILTTANTKNARYTICGGNENIYLQHGVDNLVEFLRLAYPENKSFNAEWQNGLTDECSELGYFSNIINTCTSREYMAEFLSEFDTRDIEALRHIMGLDTAITEAQSNFSPYIATISFVDSLVESWNNDQGAERILIKCPVEQLQTIMRDYTYLRMLRNMINHANDRNIPSRANQEWYLTDPAGFTLNGTNHVYPPLEGITSVQVCDVLNSALDHLVPIPRGHVNHA